MNFTKNYDIKIVSDHAATATTAVTTSIIDTQGCQGVTFIVPIASNTASSVVTATIQQSATNAAGGMAALSGAVATVTGAASSNSLQGKSLVVEVVNPSKRYVRVSVARTAAASVLGNIVAIRHGVKMLPVEKDATVSASTIVVSPAEA